MRSSAHAFEVVLIERVPRPGRALLEPDGVDAGQPLEVQAQAAFGEVTAEKLHRAFGRRERAGCCSMVMFLQKGCARPWPRR